jgi:hypothetical protein
MPTLSAVPSHTFEEFPWRSSDNKYCLNTAGRDCHSDSSPQQIITLISRQQVLPLAHLLLISHGKQTMNTLTNSKNNNAPDPTFGVEGKVLFNLPGISNPGSSVLQTDGKILSVIAVGDRLALVRHLNTGVVDSLFGDQGIKYIDLVPRQPITKAWITCNPMARPLYLALSAI